MNKEGAICFIIGSLLFMFTQLIGLELNERRERKRNKDEM